MTEPQTRVVVSINGACEIVGVSRRTMYNWLRAGKIDYVRTAGGSVRIFADTLYRPASSSASPSSSTTEISS